MGQVDANLRSAIDEDLPEVAPSYFFVDIQPDQLAPLVSLLEADAGVTRIDSAPMLRGVLTQINGRPAAEVAGEHWVIQGDRGITYRDTPPEGGEITDGAWWPAGYDGPPLVAFAAEEALEMGLGIGDEITVNILGRDIAGEIAALIDVDFSDAGIGFILTFSPNALVGAPHTHIATIHGDEADEAQILRDVGRTLPNVTAIRVRDAIDQVSRALSQIAAATSLGAGVTLLTGLVVLVGAAASGEQRRAREAAILKTLGAERGVILRSFALRFAILGGSAGIFAVAAGAVGAWAVQHFVMDSDYIFEPLSAIGHCDWRRLGVARCRAGFCSSTACGPTCWRLEGSGLTLHCEGNGLRSTAQGAHVLVHEITLSSVLRAMRPTNKRPPSLGVPCRNRQPMLLAICTGAWTFWNRFSIASIFISVRSKRTVRSLSSSAITSTSARTVAKHFCA